MVEPAGRAAVYAVWHADIYFAQGPGRVAVSNCDSNNVETGRLGLFFLLECGCCAEKA
ncbi:MAG TPA: hypothetical protein VLG49_07895 [Rhabdochlamydiaceae bacterium]|nr:hypothetical protein [Rhabdochlamydiaceae bacterium]